MTPETDKKITINLIPKKRVSLTERFLSWLLSFGRYIIIGTELVVFAVFISRFQLDTRFADLSDSIRQGEAIVKSLEDVDTQARAVQIRLAEIKRLSTLQEDGPEKILILLPQLTPDTISLDSITFQDDTVTFGALANSSAGFSLFVQNLRASNQFRNIGISGLSKDDVSGGLRFNVAAQLITKRATAAAATR